MSLTKLSTLAVLASASSLLAQAPANDLCADAQVVTLGTFAGDNTGATLDPSTPAWTIGNGVTGDVYFEYTATFDGPVTIEFCGSTGTHTDTEIEVFDGGCGALNLIASNADGCAGTYLSTVTFNGTNGTVYTFRVGGWGGEEGSFDGVISAAPAGPANDDCAGAVALVLGPQSGDNTNATVNASDPAWTIGNGVTADVWYQYTPAVDAPLSLTSCGSAGTLTDTVFEVFTGSCGALSLIAANDDGCGVPGDYLSTVEWLGQAGVTYSIRVGGWGGASGTYDLDLSYGAFAQTVSLNGGDESTTAFQFGAGDTITTRYYEAVQGSFVVQTLNVGADVLSVGSTPLIPGFEQLWAGTTPAGNLLDFPAVLMVNGASNGLTIPPSIGNFLSAGDQVRLQPLYLDFVSTPLPVIAANAIKGTYFPSVSRIPGTEEGFESGAIPAGWVDNGGPPLQSPAGSQVAWSYGSFTPSGGTGPQNGALEGSEFMYTEGSGAPPYGFTYEITSPSQSGGAGVGFAVNATGTAIGTLTVSVDDGTGPQVIYTLNGANGDWAPVLAALPAGLGSSYTVTFSYTAGLGWSSDIGIDDFYIYQ